MMQAFLWRHLTPSQELIVAVGKARWSPLRFEPASFERVRIPAGGTATVHLRTRGRPRARNLRLELSDPPEGLAIENVGIARDGLTFQLEAEGEAAKVGFAGNLVLKGSTEYQVMKDGKPTGDTRRVELGVLPALPFVVVEP
jgi:hypothetical protein